ncbi:Alkanesulfonates-binding protein [Cronobacter sakazakii 701]|nr:Alkanesulfonates-binding protein [Cronobacter sakazakii 701]
MLNLLRRHAAPLLAASLTLFTAGVSAAEPQPEALRIGYQKGSVSMVLAKSHHLLEQRYPNTKITWVEFPAGGAA